MRRKGRDLLSPLSGTILLSLASSSPTCIVVIYLWSLAVIGLLVFYIIAVMGKSLLSMAQGCPPDYTEWLGRDNAMAQFFTDTVSTINSAAD